MAFAGRADCALDVAPVVLEVTPMPTTLKCEWYSKSAARGAAKVQRWLVAGILAGLPTLAYGITLLFYFGAFFGRLEVDNSRPCAQGSHSGG